MSKIIKNILVILLLAIIFISHSINIVKAVFEISDAYIEKIGSANYHLKYYQESVGKHTYLINSVVGYKSNGKFFPAYCLNRELSGVGVVDNYSVDIDSIVDNNQIWRAVKNGYPYKTATEMGLESDFDAYVVTKHAIYCLIGQSDINLYKAEDNDKEAVAMLNSLKNLVDIGKNIDESFKEDLKITKLSDLVEDGDYCSITYNVTSSMVFSGYKITNITGITDGDLITDENGNIKTLFNSGEKFKVKILKNNLNSNKEINIEVEGLLKSYPMFYGKTRISGTQNYLLTANVYKNFVAKTNLNLKLNTGKIVVNKIDSETKEPIEGATFDLYNSNSELIKTQTTDKNGKIEFSELFQGKYTLKETQTNNVYVLDDISNFELQVLYNQTSTIDIENKHKKGNLTIYKLDKDNNNIALDNVEFELFSANDNKLIGSYKTDENGKIEINNLNTGNYILKETKTNEWYNLANNKQIDIQWNETAKEIVENELKKSQIKVIKVDKDNNAIKIANVEFEVLDTNNNVLEIIKTNEFGEALTKQYAIRDYPKLRLHEIKTDNLYELNNEIKEVVLEEKVKEINFENEKQKGQIRIIKVDKDNNEIKLEGVEFNILNENKDIVEKIITDKEGCAITSKLPIDQKYLVQEIKTKENYVLSDEIKPITVKQNQITEITFENEKKKGQIRIIKQDKDNNEIKLEGIEFNVLDENKEIIEKIVTDKEGCAVTCKLPIDQKYLIQEIKTKENYILSDEIKTITIEEDKIKDIVWENEKIKGKIIIIKTAKDKSQIAGIEENGVISGAKFEIYDNNGKIVDTISTDSNGIAISKDLEKGKYKIKEVETNKWYIVDNNLREAEIKENNEQVTIDWKNEAAKPKEEVEKTGPNLALAQEEIEYKINLKNTGNVSLDNFILEDKLPVEHIKLTKMKLGTFNKKCTYSLYYKTNFSEDYELFLEDINSSIPEEIDFTKELATNEYITNIKIDFGKVDVDFKCDTPIFMYAKVKENVKRDDVFENKVILTSNYKGYNFEKDSSWKTKIYKILPKTGF